MSKAGKQYFDMEAYKFKVHEDRSVILADICQEIVNIICADITGVYIYSA